MLRAFVSLAETLNLAKSAERLRITRQTLRRHINDLEAIRGGALFELDRQSYRLTARGRAALPGAIALIQQSEEWCQDIRTASPMSQHLEGSRFVDDEGRLFASQQHPVSAIGPLGTPLMADILAAWGMSTAQIDTPPFSRVLDHLVVYRRQPDGWVCVSIGEKAAYTRWFGTTWARSAVGCLLHEDRAGDRFNAFVGETYQKIYSEGGVRLDHLFAHLPRESEEGKIPVAFQRVLFGCAFPDGCPALGVLIRITQKVVIPFLPDDALDTVPKDVVEEFLGTAEAL